MLADEGGDACDLLRDAGGAIDAGGPQPRGEQMTSAEDVQRQIAVTVVVSMEVTAFLVAVKGHVGGVGIEHEDATLRFSALGFALAMRAGLRIQGFLEDVEEQLVDRSAVVADLVIAVRRARLALLRRMLETVERAFAGERRAAFVACLELAHDRGEEGIVAQPVVVVEVGIAERLADDPLARHRHDLVLDEIGIAPIGERRRDAIYQPDRPIGPGEQQRAAVRGDLPAVECRHDRAPLHASEIQRIRSTVCRHRAPAPLQVKSFS